VTLFHSLVTYIYRSSFRSAVGILREIGNEGSLGDTRYTVYA